MPITTNVVSLNPTQARCTPYNFRWKILSVTCDRSVVFSTNKIDRHAITEILLKVALNTITLPIMKTFVCKVIHVTADVWIFTVICLFFFCSFLIYQVTSIFHNKVSTFEFFTGYNSTTFIFYIHNLRKKTETNLMSLKPEAPRSL